MPDGSAVPAHLTHVHTPIQIAGVTVPNRIVRAAHSTRIGGGLMTDDLIAFHELRARGGVGLTILEIMGVHPSSPSRLNAYEPSQPERFGKLIEAVRPHGMKLFQQLWHGGHNAETADGGPPWSSSDIPSPSVGVVPVAMTKGMIDDVIEAFAAAALKVQSWGIAGVELHAGHGYLFSQFLTPYLNDRTDDYGGSPGNRARFLLDTAQAVRSAVRPGFAVGVRLAPDHTVGGIDVETCIDVAHMLEERGLIDFVDISAGNKHTYHKMIGGMHEPTGYELGESEQIARAVRSVTMVTGRFRTIDDADQAIRQGSTDMVAMVRATIADPFIVKKSFEGRPEQVRPCIGCNQGCVAQVLAPPFRMGCTVNPSTGFELHFGDHLLQPAEVSRHVVVVGGGPAGMEAARVAAIRGHRVTVFEAQPRLGGTIRLAAQAPTRAGIADVTHWLEHEIYRLGVDVRLSSYVDADEVLAETPDVVIVATGSMPRMDGIQITNPGEPIRGMDQPHVLSSHDVFEGGARVSGRSAVVIDDVGHYEGVAVAEQLASRGLSVTYAARTISFAPRMDAALMTEPALQRLSKSDVEVLVRTRALSIEHDAVILAPTYLSSDTNRTRRVLADVVVFVSNNRPVRDLYDALASRVEVILVGDAQAPRFLPTAMREGHLAGARLN